MSLSIVSWNVFGARWLELPSEDSSKQECPVREERKQRLNDEIGAIIEQHHPEVIAFQETVEYSLSGRWRDRLSLIDKPSGYHYSSSILVDSMVHPHSNKWKNVRAKGQWPTSTLFGQGNAFLIREDLSFFPPSSLPKASVDYSSWLQSFLPGVDEKDCLPSCVQNLTLDSGMYFGDRDTEPRGCSILHIVSPFHQNCQEDRPLDIFILNTHLTTLLAERKTATEDGMESVKQAIAVRKSQLKHILDNIVLRYETWMQDGFRVRGKPVRLSSCETLERWTPLWIILGDFNFLPSSEEYNWFVSQGVSDLSHKGRVNAKSRTVDSTSSRTVDYIFMRQPSECGNLGQELSVSGSISSVKSTGISDHCPILAKINITI